MTAAMPNQRQADRHGADLKLHRSAGFGEVSIAPSDAEKPFTEALSPAGTQRAIRYIPLSGAANSAQRRGRGGARNRRDRQSWGLTAAQSTNLRSATVHAEVIGLPFTRMITVHWQKAGVPLTGMAKATSRYLDLLSKALSRHGHKSAWLFVHENGEGKGGHVHVLAHVPAEMAPRLAALQKGWIRRISGSPYRKNVIKSRPIGGRLGLEASNPDLHAVNLEAALGYVLKGADADATPFQALPLHEGGGLVIGKRCGISQNIGPKARKAGAKHAY